MKGAKGSAFVKRGNPPWPIVQFGMIIDVKPADVTRSLLVFYLLGKLLNNCLLRCIVVLLGARNDPPNCNISSSRFEKTKSCCWENFVTAILCCDGGLAIAAAAVLQGRLKGVSASTA